MKVRRGILGRLVYEIALSADGWTVTQARSNVSHRLLGACSIVTQPAGHKALLVVIGPLEIVLGWVTP